MNNSGKENRLKLRKDFTRVYKKGKSTSGKSIVLCHRKTNNPMFRVGFSVSKKVGNAVVRNKVRRQLKEIVRLNPHLFKTGYDYVIIARPCIVQHTYNDIKSEVEKLLNK